MTVRDQEQAAERARSGSRRKRDQEARAEVDQAPDRDRLARAEHTPQAAEAWDAAGSAVRAKLPPPTFNLWIRPAELVGEDAGALVVAAPPSVATWIRRRYGRLLGDAVRELSDYRGVFVCEAEPVERGDQPL